MPEAAPAPLVDLAAAGGDGCDRLSLEGGVAVFSVDDRAAGLVAEALLRCVELLELGETACEARDSTSSMEWDCQPWLTLIMAYERRVRSSVESYKRHDLLTPARDRA